MEPLPMSPRPKRALISVTDKTGLIPLAKRLVEIGFEIVSTGGTAKAIKAAGVPCTTVEEVTGFPEIDIKTFDLVVVNLYQFAKDPSIENIDVGGPSMLRAAAKNYQSVIVIVDPKDYEKIMDIIETDLPLSPRVRLKLAVKVFEATEAYDHMIVGYLNLCLMSDNVPNQGATH